MQKTKIIALIMIVAAIVILVNESMKTSKYATFKDAYNTESIVKISGELANDKPIIYDGEKSFDETTFYLVDANGDTNKVILNKPKPQDFERAEKVVVDGKMKDGVFYATEILTKCPSKYKDEEIKTKAI